LFGIGYSFIWGPTATAAVSIVSKQKAGISSGSFITIQEIGGTFGLAFIVSYVRYFPDLLQGYNHGMLALLGIGCAGCLCAAAMSPFFGFQSLKEAK
jgi:hypothetical protein